MLLIDFVIVAQSTLTLIDSKLMMKSEQNFNKNNIPYIQTNKKNCFVWLQIMHALCVQLGWNCPSP